MERLIGRIVYGTAGGRDLVSLRNSIEQLAAVHRNQVFVCRHDIFVCL